MRTFLVKIRKEGRVPSIAASTLYVGVRSALTQTGEQEKRHITLDTHI